RARAAHARFVDPRSDFNALLNLWQYVADQAGELSGNAFRRMCRREYLHYLRIREWQDLHAQLRQIARGLGMRVENRPAVGDSAVETRTPQRPAATAASATQGGRGSLATDIDSERVHTALLSGLLSHIGLKQETGREYQGTRGSSFVIWPGSSLARSGPRLVVVAELVETSRLWGRVCAGVEPEWVERVGGELLRRSYSEPRWDARRASVVATEKVTLLGVTLVGARTVQFDRIDPELSRELFIRHALVERDWQTRHTFFAANQQAIDEVAAWEERTRRRDIVVDDDTLFALYDARIPPQVTSGRHFDSWWKKAQRGQPGLLTLTPDMLIAAGAERFDAAAYPDRFTSGGVDLDLDYVFDPLRSDDGVTVTIPLAVLARVDPAAFERQIPGLRSDLAVALIRSLPKTLRRNFVPAPDFAAAALSRIEADSRNSTEDSRIQTADRGAAGSLPAELAATLTSMTGIVVRQQDFDLAKVPDHLRMTFTVVDADGRPVGSGKDLPALQDTLKSDVRKAVASASGTVELTGLTEFPAGGLDRTVTSSVDGHRVEGYPALVDEGKTVGVTVFASAADQARAMRSGTRRLLMLHAPSPLAHLRNSLSREQLLTLAATPYGSVGSLVADATEAAIDALLDWAGGPVWTPAAFDALNSKITAHLHRSVRDVVVAAERALRAAHDAARAIDALADGPASATVPDLLADMRAQLAAATASGFMTSTGAAHLPDLTRYLQALGVRACRVRDNPGRDRQRLAEIGSLTGFVEDRIGALPPERGGDPDVRAVRRMLQEYRIASFAQPMRTAVPVSVKRIQAAATGLPTELPAVLPAPPSTTRVAASDPRASAGSTASPG
ncbi:MAG TPA: DUF3418 domain-containing protein, partial [Mycobacterium sp.]